jgi:phosphoglycerate dehydrogenase-like enzyme
MPNLLINLPAGFFEAPILKAVYKRLGKVAAIRKTSYNTAEEIKKDLAWADAVIMWSWPVLTPELLDNAPKLKFGGHLDISQRGAKLALERGLSVSVTRRAFSPAVSELALGLILSTMRDISTYHAAMRAGKEPWIAKFPDEIPPLERQLTGRNVGLVGFGAVGQRLAELLAPFRVNLRTYDPHVPAEVLAKFNAQRLELLPMIKQSEIIVICAASNPGSQHLIGKREIAALQKNAIFINVARAALVDTKALIARLKKKDLIAALDVFDQEPLERNSPLRKLPNAFLTPHRAGGVLESVHRIMSQLTDDFEAHLEGKPRAHALSEKMIPMLDA